MVSARAFFCFPRETSEKIIEHRTLITTLTCFSFKYISDYERLVVFSLVVCVVVSIFMAVRDYNFGIRFLKILLYIYVVRDSIRWGIFRSIFVILRRFQRQKIDLWIVIISRLNWDSQRGIFYSFSLYWTELIILMLNLFIVTGKH